MERFVVEAVEKYKQLILDVERHIWKTPETGFKEVQTSAVYACAHNAQCAARAKGIIAAYKPEFTVPEYVAAMEKLNRRGERIVYEEDKVTVVL